jgi:glutaredoxin
MAYETCDCFSCMFDRTLLSQSIPKQCIDLTKLDHWEVVNKIQRVHENRALGKNNASRTRIPVVFLDHFGVPVYRQNV